MISRRLCIALAAVLTLAVVVPSSLRAQVWPTRPITMVVPFPAGGNADVVARLVAAELSEKLGQQVVVENRAGAGGNVGAAVVARAEPDGYTLLFATPGPGANNKLLYKKMPYDPEDLTPIVEVADSPLIMVASPNSPVKTIKDLIAYAKANPGKLNVGFPGNGTLGHFALALLQRQAGIKLTFVPYRGTTPLTTDVLGGQIDIASDFITTYVPLVSSGKLTALAVTSPQRSQLLPQVPTSHEVGLTDFDAAAWFAVVGPKGLPAPIVDKVNMIVNAYLKTDTAKAKFLPLGLRPVGGTPEQLRKLVQSEIAKWGSIIQEANISLE